MVRKWLGDLLGGPEVVLRPSRSSGSGPRPSRWSKSGWETLPKVQKLSEALPDIWKWSGDPPEGPEVVGTSSRKSGGGW